MQSRDMNEIDAELLICLVEARPVLWDKTLDIFKDRNKTRDAWREVCSELRGDFNELLDSEKNAFGKHCFFIYFFKYKMFFK